MNAFDEVMDATAAAIQQIHAVEQNSDAMARLISGRLRHVNENTLRALKRQLREFDSVTGKWKV
ncbi:MAG: hypothetical protein ACREPX_01655 [Rhodanobacteraceae bacterium]